MVQCLMYSNQDLLGCDSQCGKPQLHCHENLKFCNMVWHCMWEGDGSVQWLVMGWKTRIWYPAEANIFLLAQHPDQFWGPSSLLPKRYWWVFFPWAVKQPEHETDYPLLASDMELNLHSPYVFMVWCLVKCGDNFSLLSCGICSELD